MIEKVRQLKKYFLRVWVISLLLPLLYVHQYYKKESIRTVFILPRTNVKVLSARRALNFLLQASCQTKINIYKEISENFLEYKYEHKG